LLKGVIYNDLDGPPGTSFQGHGMFEVKCIGTKLLKNSNRKPNTIYRSVTPVSRSRDFRHWIFL